MIIVQHYINSYLNGKFNGIISYFYLLFRIDLPSIGLSDPYRSFKFRILFIIYTHNMLQNTVKIFKMVMVKDIKVILGEYISGKPGSVFSSLYLLVQHLKYSWDTVWNLSFVEKLMKIRWLCSSICPPSAVTTCLNRSRKIAAKSISE